MVEEVHVFVGRVVGFEEFDVDGVAEGDVASDVEVGAIDGLVQVVAGGGLVVYHPLLLCRGCPAQGTARS